MRHMVMAAAIAAGMMAFSAVGFAQCKIVVVNMQDAVTQSNEGKEKALSFDAKVADWTKKLDAIKAELDTNQKKLQSQQSLASADVIATLNKTIRDKTSELQRTQEDAQKDVDDFREQLLSPVMQVADEVMNALATEKGYSIVYDSSAQNSPIVYSSKECDITNEVKTRMNAKPSSPSTTSSTPATGGRGAAPAAAGGAAGRGNTPAAPATGTRGTAPATPAPATGTRGTAPTTPPATPAAPAK